MDHLMPGMDGIETVKRLHSEKLNKSVDTPIVALTANAVSTAREMFMSVGFDGFVSKPIEIAELERVFKRVRRKEQGSQERIAFPGYKLRRRYLRTDLFDRGVRSVREVSLRSHASLDNQPIYLWRLP